MKSRAHGTDLGGVLALSDSVYTFRFHLCSVLIFLFATWPRPLRMRFFLFFLFIGLYALGKGKRSLTRGERLAIYRGEFF